MQNIILKFHWQKVASTRNCKLAIIWEISDSNLRPGEMVQTRESPRLPRRVDSTAWVYGHSSSGLREPAQCLGGHTFKFCQGLRLFLCPWCSWHADHFTFTLSWLLPLISCYRHCTAQWHLDGKLWILSFHSNQS